MITIGTVRAACADLPPPAQHRVFELARPVAAAILVPVIDVRGQAAVIVTKRLGSMRSHAGHWVFPGGRVDPGESADAAARREASEELGVDPGAIEVIGQLDTHGPIISGYLVEVYVGIVASTAELRPDPNEVAEVAVVELASLLSPGASFLASVPDAFDPGAVAVDARRIFDADQRPMRWYAVREGEHLWGMQGNILFNLLVHVSGGRHRLGE